MVCATLPSLKTADGRANVATAGAVPRATAAMDDLPEFLPALSALAASAFTSATLLPGTSEALLLALRAAGAAPDWQLLIVASIANIAGSCVNWLMGRFVNRLKNRPWFPANPQRLARAEAWYARYGKWTLLLSWVPVIGDPLVLAAGTLRVRFAQMLALVSVAKTGRYAALLWLAGLF